MRTTVLSHKIPKDVLITCRLKQPPEGCERLTPWIEKSVPNLDAYMFGCMSKFFPLIPTFPPLTSPRDLKPKLSAYSADTSSLLCSFLSLHHLVLLSSRSPANIPGFHGHWIVSWTLLQNLNPDLSKLLIFSLLGCPVWPDNIIQHCHINIHFSPHWTQVSAQLVQDIFFSN